MKIAAFSEALGSFPPLSSALGRVPMKWVAGQGGEGSPQHRN